MTKRELLAPAGDIEAGYAALYYGADAVYLGLPKFSARATATNFDEPALNEFTAYAHHLKRKVYAAINTILQEDELQDLLKMLDMCVRCKIDGVILQDLGVARVMQKKYPQIERHASTQMAVHNKEGALFLQKMGFKRVVLARELTLAEIKDIASIPNLETEAFIHGALCYSYSGLCQFSAMEYGRSANRGKCLYPCRACFKNGDKEAHYFSMKDMALQEKVLQMPVTSLKIEGRKKSALYVAAVTDYYRQILDGKGGNLQKEEHIKQIFSRPWCKFHLEGRNKDIIDRGFVGHRGLLIGEVEQIARGWLCFKSLHKISRHDGLQIDADGMEKPFGFSVQKIRVNKQNVFEAKAGAMVEVELPRQYPTLKKGDKVYLASSSEVKGAYHYEKPKAGLYKNNNEISVKVEVLSDKITAAFGKFKAMVKGQFTPANNPQKSREAIEAAFAKTGDTNFNLAELQIENPDNLFTPSSLLNELRRDLYSQIKFEQPIITLPEVEKRENTNWQPKFAVKVDNLNYLKNVDLDAVSEIIYLINPNSDLSGLNSLPKNKIRIALPAVCRSPRLYAGIIDKLLAGGYKKWEAANYWALEVLPLNQLDISLDSSLYMLNTQAIAQAKEIGVSQVTLSVEDTKINICKLIENSPLKTNLIIYQDVPLFTSVGCIRDNDCQTCSHQDKWFNMTQNGHKYKALSRDCQMILFDANPYCIVEEAKNLQPYLFRMDFCYCEYSPEKVANIVNKILLLNDITDCNIKGNFQNTNI